MTPRNRLILVAMSLSYAMAMFHRTAFPEIAADVTASTGIGSFALGALGSAFFWAYLLFQVPAGILVDAYGARRVSAAGSFAMLAGAGLFASLADPIAMAVARGLTGAGAVASFLALASFCNRSYGSRSSAAVGLGMMIGNLGGIAAGIPLALVLSLMDWRNAWWVAALASAVVGLATLRSAPRDEPAEAPTVSMAKSVSALRHALMSSDVYLGAGALAGLAGAFYAYAGFGVHMAALGLGLGQRAEGALVSALLLGFAAGSWLWGREGNNLASRARVARAAPIAALGLWIVAFSVHPASVWLLGCLFVGIGLACASCAILYSMLDELAAPEAKGAFKAAANCGIALGASVAQLCQGVLPHSMASLPSLALAALGAACCWALANRCRDVDATTQQIGPMAVEEEPAVAQPALAEMAQAGEAP